MIHYIKNNDILLGIIIKNNYDLKDPGIIFFTDDNANQQLGYMKWFTGHDILPHRHNKIKREINFTSEVLFVKSGTVRVDFYDENEVYLESYILESKDVILLCSGGHGFSIINDAEIIEVKQGPYSSENDKIGFNKVISNNIKIINL